MKIYLVIDEDRHLDVGIELFYSKEMAVKRAKEIALNSCSHKEDYQEEICKGSEWIIDITYSCEGDHVHVEEAGMEDEPDQ